MELKEKAIYFDMDGTLADLYSVKNWRHCLSSNDETPYIEAKVLLNMQALARLLNRLQSNGYHIGIISWLAKNATSEYNERVIQAKKQWLNLHLHSVSFDEIRIVEYGKPKQNCVEYPFGVLFDDEYQNRENWKGQSFDVNDILKILKSL